MLKERKHNAELRESLRLEPVSLMIKRSTGCYRKNCRKFYTTIWNRLP